MKSVIKQCVGYCGNTKDGVNSLCWDKCFVWGILRFQSGNNDRDPLSTPSVRHCSQILPCIS